MRTGVRGRGGHTPRGGGAASTPASHMRKRLRTESSSTVTEKAPKKSRRARVSSEESERPPREVTPPPNNPAAAIPKEYFPFSYGVGPGLDKCAMLTKLLEEKDGDLSDVDLDDLTLLQHELETLLSHAADFSRQLHGELKYIETGDYPTSDLRKRLVPTFTIREKEEPMDNDDDEIDLMGPETESFKEAVDDIDAWPPASIPLRFWTFCKHEFLKPINAAYMLKFKAHFLDAYNEESMKTFLLNEPWKHRRRKIVTTPRGGRRGGKRRGGRRKTSMGEVKEVKKEEVKEEVDEGMVIGENSFCEAPLPLVNNLLQAYMKDLNITIKEEEGEESRDQPLSPLEMDEQSESPWNEGNEEWSNDTKENGHVHENGVNGHINGIIAKTEVDEEGADIGNRQEAMLKELRERAREHLVQKGCLPAVDSFKCSPELAGIRVSEEGREGDEPLDEVSMELLELQKSLKKGLDEYRQISNSFYSTLKSEYAYQELNRSLNSADDELIRLGGLCYREPPLPRRVANDIDMAVLTMVKNARVRKAQLLFGRRYRGLRWKSLPQMKPRQPSKEEMQIALYDKLIHNAEAIKKRREEKYGFREVTKKNEFKDYIAPLPKRLHFEKEIKEEVVDWEYEDTEEMKMNEEEEETEEDDEEEESDSGEEEESDSDENEDSDEEESSDEDDESEEDDDSEGEDSEEEEESGEELDDDEEEDEEEF